MLVETCVLTGEAAALKTIIDLFLLAAYTYIAGFKQLALLLSAPLASCYGQMIQKLLKVRILCKDGFVKQVHKPLCVHIKIAQCPFEFVAMIRDVSVRKSKALSAMQTARGNTPLDKFAVYLFHLSLFYR